MKKYDCPECGAEMHNGTFQNVFHCRNKKCGSTFELKALEHIDKLKSQLHKMRNCENCRYSHYEDDNDYCLELPMESMGPECINNNRRHWRMKE